MRIFFVITHLYGKRALQHAFFYIYRMELKEYLEAYRPASEIVSHESGRLGGFVHFYNEDFRAELFSYDVFIVGVPEGRRSVNNETCGLAPDKIRESLYDLYRGDWSSSILDLGNLRIGNDVDDTYVALKELVTFLVQKKKCLLVLGGGHDLITPIYRGHASYGNLLNFASLDAYLDFQDGDEHHSKSFLSPLLASDDSLISQYTLLGYQSYLCSPQELQLLEQMDVNLLRLAEVNADIRETEPCLRGLDHLSVDVSVVKSSEAPASEHASPNGISAADLCAMLRYAGMSPALNSVLLSELNPLLDLNNQSAKAFAQAIWYFLEGYEMRSDDLADQELNNFQKFHVSSEWSDLVFYKSKDSSRWWVQLPLKDSLLPCSFLDYKKAIDGLISDRIVRYLKF